MTDWQTCFRCAVLMAIATAATSLPCAPVHAQYQLDNNLQAGSGGINERAVRPDYAARNQLLYGNVSGLGYFHGNVPYSAPGDFRGRLGSDDLYRFRAQSYSPTSQRQGYYDLSGGVGRPVIVPRSGAAPTAGMINQGIGVGYRGLDPDVYRYDPLRGTVRGETSPTRELADRLGYLATPQGRLLEVKASPLLGVRLQAIDGRVPAHLDGRVPNAHPGGVDVSDRLPITRGSEDGERTDENDRRLASRVETGVFGIDPEALPTSIRIGAQIQAATSSQQVSAKPGERLDERIARLQAATFSPLGSQSASPGEDVYLDLVKRIRDARDRASGKASDDRRADTLTGDTDKADDGSDKTDAGGKTLPHLSGLAAPLDEPTAEQLEAAQREADRALRRALGLPDNKGEGTEDESADGDAENDGKADVDAMGLPKSLDELVKTLNHDLPPLPSLAGKGESNVNVLMKRAERSLAGGDYFDAEAIYSRILHARPNHAMARVGMIHAQLGAGMIRSASLNLRRLMEQHPAMIATRFQANLLPPTKRLEWVRKHLEKMIEDTNRPEPALMLAYLGYQTGSNKLVVYGLDLAAARAPKDALLPLLRRIWIEKPNKQSTRPQDATTEQQ